MNKLIYTIAALLTLTLFSACGSDDDITGKNEEIVYPKTDSIFGYRFGSSMEEVKPDIIRNDKLAFSLNKTSDIIPATVFHFQDGKLNTICKYYQASILAYPFQELFLNDIAKLSPPQPIEIIKPSAGEYITYLKEDSIYWTYNHLKILVRNDYFNISEKENINNYYDFLVIEYQKKK
ncbi:hypothetical protein D0T84_10630 [Dysgonomonas sp. 521]|uniref:hypothetical protein n=1 Tax=Dysgonomonas sp. 521 TaxID=2302932 RepID=UPI0013D12EA0|nr:hypothetical protein [Dysgonomonas sp. 521]NDV95369.1 hypothetical protein [Dysgonomonas sp. 521]